MSAEIKKTKVRAGHRVYVKRIVAKVRELVENLDDEAKVNTSSKYTRKRCKIELQSLTPSTKKF